MAHRKNQKPMPNTTAEAQKQTDASSSHPEVSERAKTNPPNNPPTPRPPKKTASVETLNQTTPLAENLPKRSESTPAPTRHPTIPPPRASGLRGQYHPVVARSTRNTSLRRGTFTVDPATTTDDPYFRDSRSTASEGSSEASETNPDKQTCRRVADPTSCATARSFTTSEATDISAHNCNKAIRIRKAEFKARPNCRRKDRSPDSPSTNNSNPLASKSPSLKAWASSRANFSSPSVTTEESEHKPSKASRRETEQGG